MDELQKQLDALAPPDVARHDRAERAADDGDPQARRFSLAGRKRRAPARRESCRPLPKACRSSRLGLARWLVDPANPLTPRVQVNRAWAQFFGRGIVASEEDFGTQSEPPTHPELLDWLAIEFRDRGWSMKRVHRRIVESATYRQSSQVPQRPGRARSEQPAAGPRRRGCG